MVSAHNQDRLKTGISALDKKLNGGIPAGSLVALRAEPTTQSELILYSITAQRETLYISTIRDEQVVKDGFQSTAFDVGNPYVTYITPDAAVQDVSKVIEKADDQMNVIIDSSGRLENSSRGSYQSFLNTFKNHLVNIGGVGVLHCYTNDTPPAQRQLTEASADLVFELETDIDGTKTENYLHVPKFRGGRAFDERVKLELTDKVVVDTSRDIS